MQEASAEKGVGTNSGRKGSNFMGRGVKHVAGEGLGVEGHVAEQSEIDNSHRQ